MLEIAKVYNEKVHAAENASMSSEPEAQLTVPVQNLFEGIVKHAGLGKIELIRETRMDGVRPDFAVLHTHNNRTHQKGYIELKAPDISIDPETWTGRNKKQWEKMQSQAETLIVCNGKFARLFINGNCVGEDASLPYENPENWESTLLENLIRKFVESKPTPIVSVKELSRRLATRTADLRDRILFITKQSENEETKK